MRLLYRMGSASGAAPQVQPMLPVTGGVWYVPAPKIKAVDWLRE